MNCSSLWVIPPGVRHLHYRLCPRRGLTPPNQFTPGFITSCCNIKTWPGSSALFTAWFRRISQKQFSIQWVIYITYYRFLWSQLGNLPGHCSLFPTTSTLHKEESFQANSVPLAALFLPHHPSSLSISWPATKYFSLSQILTMLHFLFTSLFAKSGAGRARLAGRFTHGTPASQTCLTLLWFVLMLRQWKLSSTPEKKLHFPSKCSHSAVGMFFFKEIQLSTNDHNTEQDLCSSNPSFLYLRSSLWTLPTMWLVAMING